MNITRAVAVAGIATIVSLGSSALASTLPHNASARAGVDRKPDTPRAHYRLLYSFRGGSDGVNPWSGLLDEDGVLYGATLYGGTEGLGTIYKLVPSGKRYDEHIVYSFRGGDDGANPWGGVIADSTGALYGTTGNGGSGGAGTAYKLAGKKDAILHPFTGGSDGGYPTGFLIADSNGNMYSTTENGGTSNEGTVFSVKPGVPGSERVLYSFKANGDGHNPHNGLLADASGALYGTAVNGGEYNAGVVFKLVPSRTHYKESFLYSFTGNNGTIPNGNLIADSSGALYGTGTWGGDGPCLYYYSPFEGCGVVFKLTPSGKRYRESSIHQFQGSDGAGPTGGLVANVHGDLFGTANTAAHPVKVSCSN